MQNLKDNAFHIAEYFVPILKVSKSKFRETGVLTPDEFVIAGDYLVHCFPTWQWCSGVESKRRPYLPANKQFLLTRNVPCVKRCDEVDITKNEELQSEEFQSNLGNDWVVTQTENHINTEPIECAIIEEQQISNSQDNEEDAMDMEDLIESGLIDTMTMVKPQNNQLCTDNSIIRRRTYDLHITYDKYYQTPRLWLQGYDENNHPLNIEKIYQDISEDHIEKTVTMNNHPHLPIPSLATVHPCKHADVMKKLMMNFTLEDNKMNVYMYLVIFLKFMQSVLPTIEYDYTRGFEF